MTAGLREECARLEHWLPCAQALTTEPGTGEPAAHGKPGSRPPWNTAAANAVMDAHAAARRIEAHLFAEVTGRPRRPRGGSDANTIAAIHTIAALAASITQDTARLAEREIGRLVIPIRQHPDIDEEERWQRVHGAACPYCQVPMLRLGERSGKVTCLRAGSCFDGNGDHPAGYISRSVSGEAFIAWQDGFCQYADVSAEDAP